MIHKKHSRLGVRVVNSQWLFCSRLTDIKCCYQISLIMKKTFFKASTILKVSVCKNFISLLSKPGLGTFDFNPSSVEGYPV